jgi:Flp pilus assembly protein TadG
MSKYTYDDPKHAPDSRRHTLSRERRGAILVLVAVSMVALMGVLVLALDTGALQQQRRMAQAAADAGALAGAVEALRGRNDLRESSARSETARNGFTTNGNTAVVVTFPTSSSNSAGTNFVKVVVQQTLPTMFAGIFGMSSIPVSSTATAGYGLATSCVVALDPSASAALSMGSGSSLTATNCNVVVNSSASDAFTKSKNSPLILNGTACVAVTGIPGLDPPDQPPCFSSGVPPTPDPLAYLPRPIAGACNGAYGLLDQKNDTTLTPGNFCGGIKISGGSSTVTLTPGMYFMSGGGLIVKSGTLQGSGVTIVNTDPPVGSAGSFGPIDFGSSGTVRLSAMTTGALAGILLYQDPLAAVGLNVTNVVNSSASSVLTGSMYFPTQALELGGGGTALTIDGGIVAQTISVKSSICTVTGFGAGSQYFPLKQATIVE